MTAALTKKGFSEHKSGHHVRYVYVDPDGRRTRVYTYVSHGAGGADVPSNIVAEMAKQMRISTEQLGEFVACSLSRDAYHELLLASGAL